MADDPWFQSHDTCVALATFLLDEGYFAGPGEVIDFFEKPWHYPDEYERYRVSLAAAS